MFHWDNCDFSTKLHFQSDLNDKYKTPFADIWITNQTVLIMA